MKATISGSMRFYNTMIDVKKNMEFGLGIECLLPTEPGSNLSLDELKEEHFKKIDDSDYLIVINLDNYIGENTREEIEYANTNHLPIITFAFDDDLPRHLGSLYCPDISYNISHIYSIYLPDTYMVPDDNLLMKVRDINGKSKGMDFKGGNYTIASFKRLSTYGKPNVNGYIYSKEEFINAMLNARMQELISANLLYVEYGSSANKMSPKERLLTIDTGLTIGLFIAVGPKYIYIKSNEEQFKRFEVTDSMAAGARIVCETTDKNITDMKIITWDIFQDDDETIKQYLERLH